MSSFWMIFVGAISVGTVIGCYLLLRWCLQNKTGVTEGESMGHTFDGIEEINNPLPRWWTIMFYITMVWGLIYFLVFPSFSAGHEGLFGWKSSNQSVLSIEESKQATKDAAANGKIIEYDREVAMADEKFGPIFSKIAQQTVEDLMADEEALKIGKRLYLQNCAQCHGSDARGGNGFPNLTDNDWLYGGEFNTIKTTLLHGRQGAMPAWIDTFGEDGIKELVAYVQTLSGREVDAQLAEAGKAKFAVCAACHGMDGKGNHAMGAPNLTDNIWLYGGSERSITETLTHGRAGVMPAWKEILGEEKIHVISAYVYSLSNKPSEDK